MRLEVSLEANSADPNNTAGRGELRRVQTWVVHVTADQVAQRQPIQLEFKPERTRWGAKGRLHVRAVVTGQGAFEAQHNVRIARES